jgi:glycosyltransferase involved in cell wall biosynthesis
MKISIITPTLNQAKFIEDTILSVKNQDHQDFEHIVIDGGSTDGTIEILKKYPHLNWISEKDNGQSQALNKGFRMATGDILAWLNSDDYYEKNIFSAIVSFFQSNPRCFFLYGDITYVDEKSKPLGVICGSNITYSKLLSNPDLVRQPSSFWRKEIWQTIGYLNEDLHVVMDYEYFLRIGKKYDLRYLKKNLSYFRYYPENKTNSLAKRQISELRNIIRANAGSLNLRFYKFVAGRHFNFLFTNLKVFIKKIIKRN